MKNKKHVVVTSCLTVCAFCLLGMLPRMAAAQVHYYKDIQFCLQWQANYVDANQGDDYLNPVDNRPVIGPVIGLRGVPVKLEERTTDSSPNVVNVYHMTTGPGGCLRSVPFPNIQRNWKITAYFSMSDQEGRKVQILSNGSPFWTDSSINTFQTDQRIWLKNGEVDDDVISRDVYVYQTPHSALMPIARTVLAYADNIDLKENTIIRIATSANKALCSGPTSSYHHSSGNVHRICFNIDQMDRKTTVVHEIGHAISEMYGGPNPNSSSSSTGYLGDAPGVAMAGLMDDPYQVCSHSSTDPDYDPKADHKLYTREWVEAAAAEGFRHFVATAVYNSRSTTSPHFTYYKAIPDEVAIASAIYVLPPVPGTPPVVFWTANKFTGNTVDVPLNSILSGGTGKQWTNTRCKPPSGFQHLGSEYDWLYFFWGLYSAGTNAFSVKEIAEVWDNATSKGQKAYCVPRTLDGEVGWTCETHSWRYVSPTKHLESSCSWGGCGTVMVPDEQRAAKEYRIGSRWSHVRDSARALNADNPIKADLFRDMGGQAKVNYSYP